jgi:hypothetical protein
MVESATVATSAAMHFGFPLLKFRMNAPFQSGSQIMLFAGMLFSVTDSKNPCRRDRGWIPVGCGKSSAFAAGRIWSGLLTRGLRRYTGSGCESADSVGLINRSRKSAQSLTA